VLVLSEVAALLGKPLAPVLPPWGTRTAASVLARAGIRIPEEVLQQLRYGRGIDNRRLKADGYRYQFTTREAVGKLAEHHRVAPLLEGARAATATSAKWRRSCATRRASATAPRGPQNVAPRER
jgi:UDP-glucose 4-epimerase